MTVPAEIASTEQPSSASCQAIADHFLEQGWGIIPGVLTGDQCAELRNEMDRIFHDIPITHPEQGYGNEHHRVKMFQFSPLIASYIDYTPVIDVMDRILGNTCHLIYNNAVFSSRQHAIDTWHTDDELWLPLPPGATLPDDIPAPCFCINTQWYLTDVGEEDGPTQVVPFSQRSGTVPQLGADGIPRWRGHEPRSLIVKAGDVVLQNWMTWHRGAPVQSQRTRYLLQFGYGRRLIAQRFYPFVNYHHAPAWLLEQATPRRRRVLGFHERGAGG